MFPILWQTNDNILRSCFDWRRKKSNVYELKWCARCKNRCFWRLLWRCGIWQKTLGAIFYQLLSPISQMNQWNENKSEWQTDLSKSPDHHFTTHNLGTYGYFRTKHPILWPKTFILAYVVTASAILKAVESYWRNCFTMWAKGSHNAVQKLVNKYKTLTIEPCEKYDQCHQQHTR